MSQNDPKIDVKALGKVAVLMGARRPSVRCR